jgi:hypothetical protein
MTPDERELLIDLYDKFNARDLDTVIARLHADVSWPNGWEGGWLAGRQAVRDYWARQWAAINPTVEPVSFEDDDRGRIVVGVHQVVRDLDGKVTDDKMVEHVYEIEDGLIKRMEIRTPE